MLVTFLIALAFMCLGILAGTLAWILAHFVKKSPEGKISVREGGFIVKAVFVLAVGGGLLLGSSLITFFISALWWLLAEFLRDITPGSLALLSLGIGFLPLVISSLGAGLVKILGGRIDASGAKNCFFLALI